MNQKPIPAMKPLKLEPVKEDVPDSIAENIAVPQIPAVSNPSIEDWAPPEIVRNPEGEYVNPNAYFEMVKLKIEAQKRYPERARKDQIEGRVTVRFTITREGGIRAVGLEKRSGFPLLDEAAVKAVEDAAPFPKPPESLFKGDVPLVIIVVFELT